MAKLWVHLRGNNCRNESKNWSFLLLSFRLASSMALAHGMPWAYARLGKSHSAILAIFRIF